MASGGSSRRPMSSDSRSFDFGSDELLFSYENFTQQKDQTAGAKRSEASAKDLHENRVGRPLANVYGQQEEFPREDVIFAVEICMKKHAENVMRNLEEISGRLTQLELFCYKLERSVGEFRTDMIHGQSEADMKLKSLEKHVHEVQRSVQIIRDKQELADAQKELTKLHLSQKETVNSNSSQRKSEDNAAATSDNNKPQNDNKDMPNLQLALALPNQISSSHPIKAPDQNLPHKELPVQQTAPPQDRYILNQANTYYTQHQPPPPPPPQDQHIQHLHPEPHYAPQRPQMQNLSHQTPPQQQPPFSQYQQQWPQPVLPQQPSSQSQVPRPQTPPTYPPYTPYQPSIVESFQSTSMPLPAPFSSAPQSIGYGLAGGSSSHPPPQYNMQRQPPPPANQGSFASSPPLTKSSHIEANPYPPQSNLQAYDNPVFANDGSRVSHPQNYHTNINIPTSQMTRNHPYGDIIEKAINMGYSRDHVANVVNLMGETGKPLDFNALLDELNMHANGGSPRAWSR